MNPSSPLFSVSTEQRNKEKPSDKSQKWRREPNYHRTSLSLPPIRRPPLPHPPSSSHAASPVSIRDSSPARIEVHGEERRQQWHDITPSGLNEQESEGAAWTWRTAGSQGVNRTDLRVDMEGREIRRLFIGNPGDYVDARQFEMLLEQFAEDNSSRRGAPPAAASFVENLSSVVVSKSYEINGAVTCPVCKDDMPITTVAKQLPCMHLYHSSCILPWLSSRNTCPVCRYELPTDDPEYERSKHATVNEGGIHGVERAHPQEVVEETYEPEVDGSSNTMDETNTREHAAQQPNGAHRRHRWLFIAAAPVVSLVSLALVLCFTNLAGNVRRQLCRRSQTTTTAHVDTRRSWWSMF